MSTEKLRCDVLVILDCCHKSKCKEIRVGENMEREKNI